MLHINKANTFEDLNGIYKEIAEEFDLETSIRFHEMFKGLQINFPMRLFSKTHVCKRLMLEYNGKNSRELSKKYGYSERWIRIVVKELLNKENNGG